MRKCRRLFFDRHFVLYEEEDARKSGSLAKEVAAFKEDASVPGLSALRLFFRDSFRGPLVSAQLPCSILVAACVKETG
jgi:hypothetical protein